MGVFAFFIPIYWLSFNNPTLVEIHASTSASDIEKESGSSNVSMDLNEGRGIHKSRILYIPGSTN